jgi:ATPase subunit of ABC transporter with duplicated ATPase domains
VGHVELQHVSYRLPDGRLLLDDVSFRVGDGAKVALVGANGAGKTTLLRLVTGDLHPHAGTVTRTGGLGVMRQMVAQVSGSEGEWTVRDLLLSVAPPRARRAAEHVDRIELLMMERDDEPTQLRYAEALAEWADAGGYDLEVLWDVCCTEAIGIPYDRAKWRGLTTLSGGEQKRLVLEALLRGPDQVLLLDEPDNFLDVPGKRWLEERIGESPKTILFVSHDRELLARTATRVVTVELGAAGNTAWVHPGGFTSYHDARRARFERLEELRRRWDEEHAKLRAQMLMYKQKAAYNSGMASRYQAAQTRLRKFEEAGPPPLPPKEQDIRMRLSGGRTGKRALMLEQLELDGLTYPFDLEVWYGDRVAVLGGNGSGKSTFLRLLAGEPLPHTGSARLGARVVPGMFAQTHARPDLAGRAPVEIVMTEHAQLMTEAMKALARYELHKCARQPFDTLSGGQQARLQILLLELGGATLLLLDEPTDNLDLPSAEALQAGLEAYQGTVLAVTHDRWFAASFDRFLVFAADGTVKESAVPVWD